MKGSRYTWKLALRQLMMELGFNTCSDDGDVWIRVAVNNSDIGATTDAGLPEGERYHEYIRIYVDNFMLSSH